LPSLVGLNVRDNVFCDTPMSSKYFGSLIVTGKETLVLYRVFTLNIKNVYLQIFKIGNVLVLLYRTLINQNKTILLYISLKYMYVIVIKLRYKKVHFV